MTTSWEALVARRCPPGSTIDQRCFRLAPTDHTGGDLRSGLYAGVFTRMIRCSVPRWVCAWVLRGTGTYVLDGRQHRFGPGDLFQRFPGQLHDLLFDDPATGCYWFAGLPPGCLAAVRACGLAAQSHPVLPVGCDTALLRRACTFHDALLRAPDDDLAGALADAFDLCIALLRREAGRRRAAGGGWLERACAMLREGGLDQPAIAAACGMSVSALRARFAAATGLAPNAWRIRQRIARAQQLLLNDVPVVAVSAGLGYPSVPAFSRQFRQACGLPPAAWRRTHLADA